MTHTGTVYPDTPIAETWDNPILSAIRDRRSIGKMTADVPDQFLIRQILEAGTWAPNHHLTEPWRFFVLEGDARAGLGQVMGSVAARRESDPARREAAAAKAATKPMRSPCVIALAVEPSLDESVPEIEEIAAGSAAAQNMLLAAHALGLAAIWRSGWIAFEPEIRDHFGLSSRARMLGFIYVGYPAMDAPARQRRSIDDVTTWLD
ncbi:MAG: nitroreductase [Chloroflexia bacterium]|nr:nitroreductase [Chloroflexia bacterium]